MDLLPDIHPRGAALLVVDMQNGFCHSEGDLARRGQGVPLRAVVPVVAQLVDSVHARGLRVYWSRQEHEIDDATRRNRLFNTHVQKQSHLPCLRGTWDAELEPTLTSRVADADYVFVKHRASCFYNTTLEVALRMHDVRTLIVAGVTTNYCVDSTVRDAYARDFDIVVVRDACAALHPDLHEASLRNVDLYHGVTATAEDVVRSLSSADR